MELRKGFDANKVSQLYRLARKDKRFESAAWHLSNHYNYDELCALYRMIEMS